MHKAISFITAFSLIFPLLIKSSIALEPAAGGLSEETVQALLNGEYGLVIPDAMNNINILEIDQTGLKTITANLDSFPVFPGFPIQVSGSSIEGQICLNMDTDPELEIVYALGSTLQAWNIDGTNVPGWPVTSPYEYYGGPAAGDIDGDGIDEIVATTRWGSATGAIEAYELNGTAVAGFPVPHGYSSRTPVLADLDGDDVLEIIVNRRTYPTGEQWVFRGNGTVYPGWPQQMSHVPGSSAAVGDITGDGVPEIVMESYDGLYVWNTNGVLLNGFPFMMPYGAVNSYSSPVLVDLDGDSIREIVFGTHVLSDGGYVFVLENDGTQMPGWPQQTNYWIYGPPAVGYIDNDNILDIAIGDQVLSPSPSNRLYAWNAYGQALPGFPTSPINAINNQPALGDLDNDGLTEIMIDDNTYHSTTLQGKYLCYNHDGSQQFGDWPILTRGTTFFHMPILGDFNLDGILDINGAGHSSQPQLTSVYIWNTGIPYNPAAIQIPVWQYNIRHNGVYGDIGAPQPTPPLSVTMTPINPPIVIPTAGGSFNFTVSVSNNTDSLIIFDAWLHARLPNGWLWGAHVIRTNLPINTGAALSRILLQYVPGFAPPGSYILRCCVGNYPDSMWYYDQFDLSKLPGGGMEAPYGWNLESWRVSGWEETEGTACAAGDFRIDGINPNPFNPSTVLSFELRDASFVTLAVYDITGREAAVLAEGWMPAGYHQAEWDASGMPSGVYFARLTSGGVNHTQKLLLVK